MLFRSEGRSWAISAIKYQISRKQIIFSDSPAFAVGRTQVLLYYFQKLLQEGRIPQVPIIIDSPMASKATAITLTNPQEYDEEARALYEMHGNRLLAIPNLRFTATAQESRMIMRCQGLKLSFLPVVWQTQDVYCII